MDSITTEYKWNYRVDSIPDNANSVFNWLKENSNSDSRVLLEDAESIYYNRPYGRGSNLIYAHININKNVKFIGGFLPYGNTFYHENIANARNGYFFGMLAEDTNYQKIIQYINDFNIQYIVVWSNKSKNFLNNNSYDFNIIENIGRFSIFEYKYTRKNYIAYISGNAKANVTYFGVREIILDVIANETSNITVSSSYFPNWHAYADGKEIPVYMDDIFLQVAVQPKDTRYNVSLVFEESPMEKYTKWLSIFSWIAVIFLIMFYKWKEK